MSVKVAVLVASQEWESKAKLSRLVVSHSAGVSRVLGLVKTTWENMCRIIFQDGIVYLRTVHYCTENINEIIDSIDLFHLFSCVYFTFGMHL